MVKVGRRPETLPWDYILQPCIDLSPPPACGFGEDAVGSPTPCVGRIEYEAPFAGASTTYLNDFTSFRPPETRLAGYDDYTRIARRAGGDGEDGRFAPLKGASPARCLRRGRCRCVTSPLGRRRDGMSSQIPTRTTDSDTRQAPWMVENRAF